MHEARGLLGPHIVGVIPDMENVSAPPVRRAVPATVDAAATEASKATWLRFAAEWAKLADEAECRPGARRQPLAESPSVDGAPPPSPRRPKKGIEQFDLKAWPPVLPLQILNASGPIVNAFDPLVINDHPERPHPNI